MLLQTNSYIVPKERRAEHARVIRRFRQALNRLGCDQFEVYEQVGANWSPGGANGRYVQIMRFRDRQHQQAVQAAERSDLGAQQIIAEFCDLINFPYQQQHGYFATGFYTSVLPVGPRQLEYQGADETADETQGEAGEPYAQAGELQGETEPYAGHSDETGETGENLAEAQGVAGEEGAGQAPADEAVGETAGETVGETAGETAVGGAVAYESLESEFDPGRSDAAGGVQPEYRDEAVYAGHAPAEIETGPADAHPHSEQADSAEAGSFATSAQSVIETAGEAPVHAGLSAQDYPVAGVHDAAAETGEAAIAQPSASPAEPSSPILESFVDSLTEEDLTAHASIGADPAPTGEPDAASLHMPPAGDHPIDEPAHLQPQGGEAHQSSLPEEDDLGLLFEDELPAPDELAGHAAPPVEHPVSASDAEPALSSQAGRHDISLDPSVAPHSGTGVADEENGNGHDRDPFHSTLADLHAGTANTASESRVHALAEPDKGDDMDEFEAFLRGLEDPSADPKQHHH